MLEDGEPILKPGLAIYDPHGPKGQTPRETSGGEKKKPSAAVTLSPPSVSLASHDTPLLSSVSPAELCCGFPHSNAEERSRNRDTGREGEREEDINRTGEQVKAWQAVS